ncbi:MAG: hypothetical protein ACTSWU_02305 [Candidatus Thorarchaeota archaeon]
MKSAEYGFEKPPASIGIPLDYQYLDANDLIWLLDLVKKTELELHREEFGLEKPRFYRSKRPKIIVDQISTEHSLDVSIFLHALHFLELVRYTIALYHKLKKKAKPEKKSKVEERIYVDYVSV